MTASPGRIVHYALTDNDCARISVARLDDEQRKGNTPRAGDIVPLLVVRVWPNGSVNGQAFLDGNDSLWVLSASEGEVEGSWRWPARV